MLKDLIQVSKCKDQPEGFTTAHSQKSSLHIVTAENNNADTIVLAAYTMLFGNGKQYLVYAAFVQKDEAVLLFHSLILGTQGQI